MTRVAHIRICVARRLRAEGGFTLVEMLTSLAVLGFLFAIFSTVTSSSVRHGSDIQERAVLQTEVRAAVDTLVADLRQSTIAGDTTLARVSTASATQLTFLSPDRATPMHLRRISYQVSGGQLQRALSTATNTASPWTLPALSAWAPVARSLVTSATPVFSYYDANGAATTVAANVRTVRIRVSVAPYSSTDRLLTYDTRVALRPAA
jgi:prepilin-type N-terminal cleavage/methylation domain-containing protein